MNTGPAKFLSSLEVTPLPDGKNWRLDDPLLFRDPTGFYHRVDKGFVTDFASIPSLSRLGALLMALAFLLNSFFPSLWRAEFSIVIFGLGFLIAWLADDLNGDDQLDAPATIHDHGYRRVFGGEPWTMKFYWDWILFVAMRANGCGLAKSLLIYFNVTVFGWLAWYQDGKKFSHA
jgi:hypothetical protein